MEFVNQVWTAGLSERPSLLWLCTVGIPQIRSDDSSITCKQEVEVVGIRVVESWSFV